MPQDIGVAVLNLLLESYIEHYTTIEKAYYECSMWRSIRSKARNINLIDKLSNTFISLDAMNKTLQELQETWLDDSEYPPETSVERKAYEDFLSARNSLTERITFLEKCYAL